MRVILASKSPRRQELMTKLGIEFTTAKLELDEKIEHYDNYQDYIKQIVFKKIKFAQPLYPDDIVICADTIVVLDDDILEKPQTKAEAEKMIQALSGRTHLVVTGVGICYHNDINYFIERTEVEVIQLSKEEILAYINLEEPYDKAGGYGIQGSFSKYISRINGDYYNVVGLPICRLNYELKKVLKNN